METLYCFFSNIKKDFSRASRNISLLSFSLFISFVFGGCGTMLNLPEYTQPNFENSGKKIGINKLIDARTTNEDNIEIDTTNITEIIADVFDRSNAFRDVNLLSEKYSETDFDIVITPKLLNYTYSEGITAASFLLSESFYTLIGGIVCFAVLEPPIGTYLGGFVTVGSLIYLPISISENKTGFHHTYDITVGYVVKNIKNNSELLVDTVKYNYSNIFSHQYEYTVGEYQTSPYWKTVVKQRESVNIYQVNSFLEEYVIRVTSEKIVDQISEQIGTKKLSPPNNY